MNLRLFKLNRLNNRLAILLGKVGGILDTATQLSYRIPYNSKAFALLKLNQDIAITENRIQKLTLESFNYRIEKENRRKTVGKEIFN